MLSSLFCTPEIEDLFRACVLSSAVTFLTGDHVYKTNLSRSRLRPCQQEIWVGDYVWPFRTHWSTIILTPKYINLLYSLKLNWYWIKRTTRQPLFFYFSADKKSQQMECSVLCGVSSSGWVCSAEHVGWCGCGEFPKVSRHYREGSHGREREGTWKTLPVR